MKRASSEKNSTRQHRDSVSLFSQKFLSRPLTEQFADKPTRGLVNSPTAIFQEITE